MTYTLTALDAEGNPLMEIEGVNWREMSSLIAGWTKQFELGVKTPEGLTWDKDGSICVKPVFKA